MVTVVTTRADGSSALGLLSEGGEATWSRAKVWIPIPQLGGGSCCPPQPLSPCWLQLGHSSSSPCRDKGRSHWWRSAQGAPGMDPAQGGNLRQKDPFWGCCVFCSHKHLPFHAPLTLPQEETGLLILFGVAGSVAPTNICPFALPQEGTGLLLVSEPCSHPLCLPKGAPGPLELGHCFPHLPCTHS